MTLGAFIYTVFQSTLGVLIAWGVKILIDKFLIKKHPELADLPQP